MRRRVTPQDRIAALMEDDNSMSAIGYEDAGPAELPQDQPTSGSEVADGRSNRPITNVRECAATGCANNVKGGKCSLSIISINEEGGCDNYEARADEDDLRDQENIRNIGDMMPSSPDLPSNISAIISKFDPSAR